GADPAARRAPRRRARGPGQLSAGDQGRRARAGLHLRHQEREQRHRRPAAPARGRGRGLQGPAHQAELARGDLREPRQGAGMNWRAVQAIYRFEMNRTWRTLMQSILAPVISTSLYFVVFGTAIGSRMSQVHGVPYGSFLVPGLIMMQVLTQSVSNASF